MNIKFMSAEHKAFFEEKVQKYHIEYDRYRLAAIYVLSLSADCRKNFSHCYDGHCCDYEALKKPWEAEQYNPADLFDCEFAPYFFEAVKILHPYYFE